MTVKSSYKYNITFVFSLIILVAIDQVTKYMAFLELQGKTPITLIKNILELNYLEGGNSGAAWGILSGKRFLFIIATALILVSVLYVFFRIHITINKDITNIYYKKFLLLQLCIVVVAAGGIGNLIDRLRLGFVIDFINFVFIDFPIFNLADCYVVLGTIAIIIMVMFVLSDHEIDLIFNKKKHQETEMRNN